jgi:hypothetical protein
VIIIPIRRLFFLFGGQKVRILGFFRWIGKCFLSFCVYLWKHPLRCSISYLGRAIQTWKAVVHDFCLISTKNAPGRAFSAPQVGYLTSDQFFERIKEEEVRWCSSLVRAACSGGCAELRPWFVEENTPIFRWLSSRIWTYFVD